MKMTLIGVLEWVRSIMRLPCERCLSVIVFTVSIEPQKILTLNELPKKKISDAHYTAILILPTETLFFF